MIMNEFEVSSEEAEEDLVAFVSELREIEAI